MPIPDSLTELKLWLKADAITGLSDGDAVGTWSDSSGLGNDASQATASKKPTYKTGIVNGLPIVRFDGVDDALVVASLALSTFTIFAVVYSISGATMVYEHSVNGLDNPGSWLYTTTNVSLVVRRNADISAKDRAVNWLNTSTWTRVTHRHGGTHATNQLYIDDVNQAMTDGDPVNWADDVGAGTATAEFNIGSRNEAGLFFNGDIAEIIACSPDLSATDRAAVQRYLFTKYTMTPVSGADTAGLITGDAVLMAASLAPAEAGVIAASETDVVRWGLAETDALRVAPQDISRATRVLSPAPTVDRIRGTGWTSVRGTGWTSVRGTGWTAVTRG